MIQFSINSELLQFMHSRWFGTRQYLPYICRIYLFPLGKIGQYNRNIATTISRIIVPSCINVGWAISDVTKIKLVVNSLDKTTKGDIAIVDMGVRLMGCFRVTQKGGLGCFLQFIPNPLFLGRQHILPLLIHYLRSSLILRCI